MSIETQLQKLQINILFSPNRQYVVPPRIIDVGFMKSSSMSEIFSKIHSLADFHNIQNKSYSARLEVCDFANLEISTLCIQIFS